MHVIPVAKFMSWRRVQTDKNGTRKITLTKDGFHLLCLGLFDQGIEDDNMFALKEKV